MGRISTPMPPMPKDPAERVGFVKAYVQTQRRASIDTQQWDTGFKIHDAGWALIGMAFAIVGLTAFAVRSILG